MIFRIFSFLYFSSLFPVFAYHLRASPSRSFRQSEGTFGGARKRLNGRRWRDARHLLIIFLLAGGGIGGEVFSQVQTTSDTSKMDTIFFLNGEVKAVKLIDTAYHLVRFLPQQRTKKAKVQEVEKSQVFSLKFSGGQERILYFHDSVIGNVFTVLEAKMFMYGEQEADKNYKNKWPFVIGCIVGASSPIVLSNAIALSPIAPALIPLHTLIPSIRINTKKIANKNYLQYDTYLMGYEKVARKKNFMRSILGAGIGLATGLGAWIILK